MSASETSGKSPPPSRRPALPSVSGTAPAARATTGTPWARASMSGAQNPSCTDIERYTSARRYQASRASDEIGPVKNTWRTPIRAARISSAVR